MASSRFFAQDASEEGEESAGTQVAVPAAAAAADEAAEAAAARLWQARKHRITVFIEAFSLNLNGWYTVQG
jgi:hypothetical protein